MKYIDADKLKAEIERLNSLVPYENSDRHDEGLHDAYKAVKNVIASLQQEQPKFKIGDTIHKIGENTVFPMPIERISDGDYVCDGGKCFVSIKFQDDYELVEQEQPDNEDIDKVAQELYEHLYELKRRNNVPTNLYDKQEIIDLWKAGIEYGRNHPRQEQPEVTSIKGYLYRDIGGQLVISLSPNYIDNEWMLLESKLFPNIKSGDVPRCVNITIKEI